MGLQNTKVTDEQVSEAINDAYESIDEGTSRWPGMTYEQGVAAALEWVTGENPDGPFEEN
ncbi:hypothetical protein SEA_FIZZLES_59 [Microbacterium phage Fizzles]|nr:hypothetical protein SEA_FIZZLES_59 [Microbacterium phage Fizzles]